ncbi:MAG: hypothetical protein A2176_12505 [Spirochaetes bacterium RBG_13_51_14]|nr:MAG: hypothetical protein A2176_12505 [Spirochaetes bacterium RBG_13_51_14]
MALIMLMHCAPVPRKETVSGNHCHFREVWAYLMKGEEKELKGTEPITDILYFGVSVNKHGRIFGSITPPEVPFSGFRTRTHLVVFKLSDPRLLHHCLSRDGTARELLIADIAAAAEGFDGIQIDFESIQPDDGMPFRDFLSDLKKRTPVKILSVTVPVRLNPIQNGKDAYDYAALAAVVDRVFVMAYDEHWKTSRAGSVASLPWCGTAADYAAAFIPRDKLVMGIPLYGRAWQDKEINRAVTYQQAIGLSRRQGRRHNTCPEKGAHFEYTERVTVSVFYETITSLNAKLRLYESIGILSIAFWRIGQGPSELWHTIAVDDR